MQKATSLFLVLLLTSSAIAAVGDLKSVAPGLGDALEPASINAKPSRFAKPTEGDGTVNEHAMIASFGGREAGQITLKAAIDSKLKDSTAPDVIRLDFSGEGDFNGKPVLPLKRTGGGGSFDSKIGPAVVDVSMGGRTIPVRVQGRYYKSGNFRYLSLTLGTALEGSCRFGQKVLRIRIVDGNGNLVCGDKARPDVRSGKIRGVVAGDTLLIDTGDGKFGRAVQKSFFGLPVKVGTDWYEVEVSGDGAKVSAVRVAIETGQIRIAHGSWSAMLVGKKHLLNLTGGPEPIDVPADEYAVMNYTERGTGGSTKAHVQCENSNIRAGNAKTLEIAAGELTEVTIGSPLTAKLKVRQQGGKRLLGAKRRQVNFSLELTDAYGASVSSLTGANGQRPPEPRIEVFDAAGKRVHSGAMKYG